MDKVPDSLNLHKSHSVGECKKEFSDLRIISTIETDKQTIRLYLDSDNQLVLTLDTFVQFKEGEDEQAYHRNLVDRAIYLHSNPKNFLILGGGDGLCSRNIYRLVPDANITLVDFDKKMVEFCRDDITIQKLNENSLQKGNFFYEDAKEWVKNNEEKFDIVILDLPDGTSEELKELYTEEFYSNVISHLEDGGFLAVQTHTDITDNIRKILEKYINIKEVVYFTMPWLMEGTVIIGKKQ